jgi:hypothetical protein
MERYKIAHVNVQNQDIIFVPLDRQLDNRTEQEQVEFTAYLQRCAASAGLRGRVVPAWETAGGRTMFRGPREWHPFFGSIDIQWVWARINRELTCN